MEISTLYFITFITARKLDPELDSFDINEIQMNLLDYYKIPLSYSMIHSYTTFWRLYNLKDDSTPYFVLAFTLCSPSEMSFRLEVDELLGTTFSGIEKDQINPPEINIEELRLAGELKNSIFDELSAKDYLYHLEFVKTHYEFLDSLDNPDSEFE